LTPFGASTSRAGRSATIFADLLDHLESTRIAALAPSR
jgi:hypothetical protein